MPILQSQSNFSTCSTYLTSSATTQTSDTLNFHSTCAPISQLTLDPWTFEWQCFFPPSLSTLNISCHSLLACSLCCNICWYPPGGSHVHRKFFFFFFLAAFTNLSFSLTFDSLIIMCLHVCLFRCILFRNLCGLSGSGCLFISLVERSFTNTY